MRLRSVERGQALVEISIEECGLILDALSQEMGIEERAAGRIDEAHYRELDLLLQPLVEIVMRLDAEPS